MFDAQKKLSGIIAGILGSIIDTYRDESGRWNGELNVAETVFPV